MDQTGIMPSTTGNGSVANAVDDLSATAHGKIDQVSSSVKPAVERLAKSAHEVVDKVATVASDAADTLGVRTDELKSVQGKWTEQCQGYVRENPLVSLGIALAAGYLLSKVLSSRDTES